MNENALPSSFSLARCGTRVIFCRPRFVVTVNLNIGKLKCEFIVPTYFHFLAEVSLGSSSSSSLPSFPFLRSLVRCMSPMVDCGRWCCFHRRADDIRMGPFLFDLSGRTACKTARSRIERKGHLKGYLQGMSNDILWSRVSM